MTVAASASARILGRPRIARRPVALAAAGLFVLALVVVAGVAAGSVFVPPGDTLAILAHRILGLDIPMTWTRAEETLFERRGRKFTIEHKRWIIGSSRATAASKLVPLTRRWSPRSSASCAPCCYCRKASPST